MTSKIDRNNHTITYTYDQLNRLTRKTYPDSTTVNYTSGYFKPDLGLKGSDSRLAQSLW